MKEENIWNTVCPVCGRPIPHDMALIELAQHQDQEPPGIRLCSKECAEIAEKSPEKYRVAARVNRVEGDGKRSKQRS